MKYNLKYIKMNKLQRNRQYMLRKLSNFLKTREALWTEETLVKDQILLFEQKKLALEESIRKEEQMSLPYADIRDQEREELNQKLSQLSGILYSLYSRAGRKEYAYLSQISPRELLRCNLEQMVAKAANILELAQEIQVEINEHTTAKKCQEDAQSLFDSFSLRMLLPSERRKERTQLLRQISKEQEDLIELLKSDLDPSMRVFESVDSNFFELYRLNREVQQSAHKKEEVDQEEEESEEDFN